MTRLPSRLGAFSAFLLLLGICTMPGFAQSEAREVEVSFGATSVEWSALMAAERVVLTVSQPGGQVIREEFRGDRASFDLADGQGNRRGDGAYKWQIEVFPRVSRDIQDQVIAARRAGDDEAVHELIRRGSLPRGVIASGAFQVLGGAIVAPGGVEEPSRPGRQANGAAPTLATKTQVINMDLIVQGSECVGVDCTSTETFGFDTIRLKENNLRIKFEDTSVGAFPSTDWQLTANDSASGGQNRFSIEDITAARVPFTVEGGSTTNSIYIDSTGRVGFRTSTPVLDIHVNTSNTPGLRLEQNNSGGFTAQTWDIAGNEANFFVRDVTGGSLLPFRIRPGAPTSSIDIAASGNVGLGTLSPSERLDVQGGGVSNIMVTTYSSGSLIDDRADLIVRKANGTSGAPTAIVNNDRLGGFQARGYDGSSFSDAAAFFDVRAEQAWTSSAHGTRLTFATTPNNTTTATTKMVIEHDGEVGIGTTNPTALLHVNGGNIQVTGGSFVDDGTTLMVPDYVFEEGYRLRPIAELASFVASNQHLPNVPSRADVKANGLNLSHFSMNLLEKVEELTLYTIEQNRQIFTLEERIAQLEAALKAQTAKP